MNAECFETYKDLRRDLLKDPEVCVEYMKDYTMREFSLQLMKEMEHRGITREQLAAMSGIPVDRLGEIEAADEPANLLEVQAIATALGYNARVVLVPNCKR